MLNYIKVICLGTCVLLGTVGCSSTTALNSLDQPAGVAGAEQLLGLFLDPAQDRTALTMALKPSDEDYDDVFAPQKVDELKAYYVDVWRDAKPLQIDEGQTEVLIYSATTEELAASEIDETSPAYKFPGGMCSMALKGMLQPNVIFYLFKFVEPGELYGMSYNGLVHVNGHWCIFPAPWRGCQD